jgi:hypothetical protein
LGYPERRSAARALRLAALASALIAALRFALNTQAELIGIQRAVRLEPFFEAAGVAALAWMAACALVLVLRMPAGARGALLAGALLGLLDLGVELMLWLLSLLGSAIAQRAEPALVAVSLWAGCRAMLWFGLFGALGREQRAPAAPLAALVPLFTGLRIVLFIGTLIGPYLEAGGEARQAFLGTATLRNWLAMGLAIACDALIAWLAGRAAREA